MNACKQDSNTCLLCVCCSLHVVCLLFLACQLPHAASQPRHACTAGVSKLLVHTSHAVWLMSARCCCVAALLCSPAAQVQQVLDLLVSCSRAEEECRNVVAECLGRLALLHPSEVLARLRTGAEPRCCMLLLPFNVWTLAVVCMCCCA